MERADEYEEERMNNNTEQRRNYGNRADFHIREQRTTIILLQHECEHAHTRTHAHTNSHTLGE